MFKLVVLYMLIAFAFCFPSKEKYDKATVNDVNINSVSSGKVENVQVIGKDTTVPPTTVTIVHTVIQNDENVGGIRTPDVSSVPKPNAGGPTFTRFIEDIFQIPITILQAVSNLITNPFRANRKSPETTAPTY